MPDITDLDQLDSALAPYIVDAISILGEDTKETLIQLVREKWYGRIPSEWYQRSMDVLSSISCSTVNRLGNEYIVEVYFDPDKIQPHEAASSNMFPSHSNITDGSSSFGGDSYGDLVPYWLNNGENSSIHSYDGEDVIEDTRQWLIEANNYLNEFASILREKTGLNVVVA